MSRACGRICGAWRRLFLDVRDGFRNEKQVKKEEEDLLEDYNSQVKDMMTPKLVKSDHTPND